MKNSLYFKDNLKQPVDDGIIADNDRVTTADDADLEDTLDADELSHPKLLSVVPLELE